MGYVRYDVEIDASVYSDYENLRKDYVGKKLKKTTMLTMFELCGLPSASQRFIDLALKYELIYRFGKAAGVYYMVPKEQPPYSRFVDLQKEFYNGAPRKPKEDKTPKVKDVEVGRAVLDEDYCLRYLKERGYMCFKLTPNLMKLQQVFTPQFLLENMDAVLK